MLKDIPIRKVEDIAIAIVPPFQSSEEEELWQVHLINLKDQPIRNVIVNSKGYGKRKREDVKTSTLRYYYEAIPARTSVVIESIQTKLFDLVHEFFVSFSINNYLYDKKYVFVKGSIESVNFTQIPIVERKGVMIK